VATFNVAVAFVWPGSFDEVGRRAEGLRFRRVPIAVEPKRYPAGQFHNGRRFAGKVLGVENDEGRFHCGEVRREGEDVAGFFFVPSYFRREYRLRDRAAMEAVDLVRPA
jgi:hypothetical protein